MTNAAPPIGLLLAAGRSRRFGSTKQLAPTCDGVPLVASSFDAIAGACAAMVVVVGHESRAVAEALGGRRFEAVPADPQAPMIESIRAGLRAIDGRFPGAPALIQPGDHADVAPATLAALFAEATRSPQKAVMPEHDDRGGHPVLVPSALFARILEEPLPDGLRGLWREAPECCTRVAVDDPSSTRDVDRQADLDRLGGTTEDRS